MQTLDLTSAPLPENVVNVVASSRSWNGATLRVSQFECSGSVSHLLDSKSGARLSVVLEEVGGRCEPRTQRNVPCAAGYVPRHMHFAPAGMEMWGYTSGVKKVKDATLIFDIPALCASLGTAIPKDAFDVPLLRFADERLWTLTRMLTDVATDFDPSTQLYGDGLTTAIAARLFGMQPTKDGKKSGLAPWQLQRVIDYLTAHPMDRVELSQLASLTQLSSSHFSRAFKVSTGVAPYRWQLDARLRKSQELLLSGSDSLEQIATATGFADAVHFGRTFRKHLGASPAAWRRARKS